MNRCCGNCNQGRAKCPAPEACQLPEDPQEGFGAIVVPLFAAPVLLAIIGVIALVGSLP